MILIANSIDRVKLHENFAHGCLEDSICDSIPIYSRKQILDRLTHVYQGHFRSDFDLSQNCNSLKMGMIEESDEFLNLKRTSDYLLTKKSRWSSVDLKTHLQENSINELIFNIYHIISRNVFPESMQDVRWLIWSINIVSHGHPYRKPASMAWHYDSHYPLNYAKLHLGLNNFNEHSGGTEFLDKYASEEYTKETQYSSSPPNSRIAHLLSESFTKRVSSYFSDLRSYCFFMPNRVMHKGIWPHAGQRRSVFVSLMPAPASVTSAQATELSLQIIKNTDLYSNFAGRLDPSDFPAVLYN